MRTGPILVGAAIGGIVWVLTLRCASRAVTPSASDGAPPPDVPDGAVRDGQGNVVGGAAEDGPLTSPAAGTGDMAGIVAGDSSSTPFQADASIAGVDGGAGGNVAIKVDGETGTVTVDHSAPVGGQGEDQMGNSVRLPDTDPGPVPAYSSGEVQYADYLRAASGSVEGLTRLQIAELLREGAQIGGLSL